MARLCLFWGNALLCGCFLSACVDDDAIMTVTGIPPPAHTAESKLPNEFAVRIEKWFDAHQAAISLTYDAGWIASPLVDTVNRYVREKSLHLGYEMVSSIFRKHPELLTVARTTMTSKHFSFFGHGDYHVYHDHVSPDSAYTSFGRCFTTMRDFGFQPVAYAYPHGSGFLPWTQQVLALSGFLSGRAHLQYIQGMAALIVPDGIREPSQWYFLPSLVMQDYAFEKCAECINNTAELVPYLDLALRHRAWLITTYHAIGDSSGWGFYALEHFIQDLEAVRQRDFWCASMNDVTLYVRERARARVRLHALSDVPFPEIRAAVKAAYPHLTYQGLHLVLSDSLDNVRYTQALTLTVDLPEDWRGKSAILYNVRSSVQGASNNPTEIQRFSHLGKSIRFHLLPDEKPYILSVSVP